MVKRIPIAVAYNYRRKTFVKQFDDLLCPDKLITNRSNLLPKGSEILQIGVGSTFYTQYQQKYIK